MSYQNWWIRRAHQWLLALVTTISNGEAGEASMLKTGTCLCWCTVRKVLNVQWAVEYRPRAQEKGLVVNMIPRLIRPWEWWPRRKWKLKREEGYGQILGPWHVIERIEEETLMTSGKLSLAGKSYHYRGVQNRSLEVNRGSQCEAIEKCIVFSF